MMSENCNSRRFPCLMKSCFPNHRETTTTSSFLQHRISSTKSVPSPQLTTISSLPDDLLLDCLSRLPYSCLPSLSLVCRRWSHLLQSPTFSNLRRHHNLLNLTLFSVSFTDSALHIDSFHFPSQTFPKLFSQFRLSSIGPRIYLIGRTATLRFDTWTGNLSSRSSTIFPRKKFANSVVHGKIYVAGGTSRTNAVEEYDPELDTWRVVSDGPRKRYGCVGVSIDGVFYVIGGLRIGSSARGDDVSRAAAEGAEYASSMDLYDVEGGGWLRSRVVPGGGCVVAACAAEGHVYILASHAVELSFWSFDGRRNNNGGGSGGGGGGFGEWSRMKSPPLPGQVRLDSRVRFSCVGVGDNVVLIIQVMGIRGGGLVLVYEYGSAAGEWRRRTDLPELEVIGGRRASCVCVEC